MSSIEGTNLSLKVMINKKKSKVLFAEANSYVADALLGFLKLPIGRILNILRQHEEFYGYKAPVIGCLTFVYQFLENNSGEFTSRSDDGKLMYMGSMSLATELGYLAAHTSLRGALICSFPQCPHSEDEDGNKVSQIGICVCGRPLRGHALTIKAATFVISDDLRIAPVHSGLLQTLSNLGISDIDGAKLKSLSLGIHDVVNLLKLSLTSSTPLTDLVFNYNQINSISPKSEPFHIGRGIDNPIEMILKVLLQKSTNKFLFAEASEDFVEFIFSVFTLPLGEAVRYFDGGFPFKTIHNLYTSVADLIDEKYFRDRDTKIRLLMNPKIGCSYYFLNQFLKIDGNEQKTFMVYDNLLFEPFSIATMVLKLNSLGVPLSDVRETELHNGQEEAVKILQASLISNTALTDALIDPMLRQPEIVMPLAAPDLPIMGAQAYASGTIL